MCMKYVNNFLRKTDTKKINIQLPSSYPSLHLLKLPQFVGLCARFRGGDLQFFSLYSTIINGLLQIVAY